MLYKKNAIIYCRISSKQQQEGWGLNSQEVSCRKYCNENGYDILNVFTDVFTGWDLDRPWLKKLFQFIDDSEKQSGEKISLLVVDDIDRIARDYGVHLEITNELKRRKIEYQSVKMKFENTSTGNFMEGTMALQAQFFRHQNKERVLSRQEARLLDGYRPRAYPVGYKTKEAPAGGRMLIKDEPSATYVAEVLELYANNSLNSIREVRDYLKGRWIILNQSTVWRMLNNILYTGMIQYSKATYEKDGILKKKRNVSLREWKHEWIISMETFEKIKKKLQRKKTYTHEIKLINEEYPLRGFVVCTCCNLPLTSWKSRSKSWKQFPYYQFNIKCLNKWKSINADILHKQFSYILKRITIPKHFITSIRKNIVKEFNAKLKVNKNSKKYLEKELTKLELLNNAIIDKITTTTSMTVQQSLEKKVEENIKLIENLNQDIKSVDEVSDITKKIDGACKVLTDVHRVWEKENVVNKHILLGLVFSKKIPVDYSTKTYWTLPLNRLYLLSRDIFDTDSQKLELCQDFLNNPKISLTELEEEIKRFYYFGSLLLK